MSHTYRVSLLIGKMDTSRCPPAFIEPIFNSSVPTSVILNESDCIVTFDTPQTPADLGPLVKVELIETP
jgi:hypothetical protein